MDITPIYYTAEQIKQNYLWIAKELGITVSSLRYDSYSSFEGIISLDGDDVMHYSVENLDVRVYVIPNQYNMESIKNHIDTHPSFYLQIANGSPMEYNITGLARTLIEDAHEKKLPIPRFHKTIDSKRIIR